MLGCAALASHADVPLAWVHVQAASPYAPAVQLAVYVCTFSLDLQSKDAEVKVAASRSVDVPLPLRQLCAARLITLADSLDKQQQQHPQQQQGGKGGKGGAPDLQQQKEQQQQGGKEAAARHEFLGSVAALVGKLQQSGAATLATAAEGEEAAVEAAEAAAETLQRTLARMQARMAAGGGTPAEQQRLRALTHLLRLLLLHTLADPASADAALAADLDTVEAVAIEGQAAPQQAAKAGGGGDGGSGSDEEDGGAGEQAPHWHDTLMDVLLSLLARNAAPLPSAPLRDAVEHAFRAFADELTATGVWWSAAAVRLCAVGCSWRGAVVNGIWRPGGLPAICFPLAALAPAAMACTATLSAGAPNQPHLLQLHSKSSPQHPFPPLRRHGRHAARAGPPAGQQHSGGRRCLRLV